MELAKYFRDLGWGAIMPSKMEAIRETNKPVARSLLALWTELI